MKTNTTLFTLGIIAALSYSTANAQTFLNGSFEGTAATGGFNLSNSDFNNQMNNCFAFGVNSQVDIINNSCGYGSAQDGNYFIGLAVDNTNTLVDEMSIKLASPLVAGENYVLNFYHRKDGGFSANLLEVGYSSSNNSFGTTISTVALPTTNWVLVELPFTPTFNCEHITIRTIAGSYGWNFIDNFDITQTTASTNTISNDQSIQVFPNPSQDIIYVKVNNPNTAFNALIRDTQGRVVLLANNPIINLSALESGIYFLEIENNSAKTVKRFIKN